MTRCIGQSSTTPQRLRKVAPGELPPGGVVSVALVRECTGIRRPIDLEPRIPWFREEQPHPAARSWRQYAGLTREVPGARITAFGRGGERPRRPQEGVMAGGVHVEHGALAEQARRLATAKNELEDKLREIQSQIQDLISNGFVTESASESFGAAADRW